MVKVNYAVAIFNEPNVFRKIEILRKHAQEVLEWDQATPLINDYLPNRDAEMVHPKNHPRKSGFSTPQGQARMLHDLASIELQAMELGLRTLTEFAEAPLAFKEELMNITLSESTHLEMCLIEIEKLGSKWGDWPIHQSLWRATSNVDSLLDRILIVHRYLEGSGLDAGETLNRRIALIESSSVKKAIHQIVTDEIGHVEFGSRWYREICAKNKIDFQPDFPERMNKLIFQLPKRLEPLAVDLRKQAGFSDDEILYLQDLRQRQLNQSVR